MRRNSWLSILFAFIIAYSYGQDKGYVAISVGPSFPNGDFGSKDVNNEAAGFATTKTMYDITYAQKFGKNLGFTLLVRGQANGVDTDPLLNELNTQFPDIPWTAESHNWGIYGLMGGLYGSFPIVNDKVTFETRAMIGYVHASSPEISFSSFTNNHYYEVTTFSATGASFGYLFGVGIKFGIGQRLGFLLNADYLGATPEFKDVLSYSRVDAYYTNTYNSFQQTFGTLNVGVGVGYRWYGYHKVEI